MLIYIIFCDFATKLCNIWRKIFNNYETEYSITFQVKYSVILGEKYSITFQVKYSVILGKKYSVAFEVKYSVILGIKYSLTMQRLK